MVTTKHQVQRIIDQLPDDCSAEDVQYHLYVYEKLTRRLSQADDAAVEMVAHDEVERRMARWLAD